MEQIAENGLQRLVIVTVSVLILIIAIVVILRDVAGPPIPQGPTQTWFYDLNTAKLFPGPIGSIPPIPAPSGPLPDGTLAGVLAHVHTCKTCAESDRAVVYLETRTPEAQAKLAALRKVPPHTDPPPEIRNANCEGILVRLPSDTRWIDNKTQEGRAIEDQTLFDLCPDQPRPRACYPGAP